MKGALAPRELSSKEARRAALKALEREPEVAVLAESGREGPPFPAEGGPITKAPLSVEIKRPQDP